MHVVIVSQCERKAIIRTAKTLDSYAVRHGDRTWVTPITSQGLDALHSELKSKSTRQTAVACYVNEGARRLRLLWTVGRKSAFGPAGAVAVATKSGQRSTDFDVMPVAIRLACLLSECAGLMHDFGKFGVVFQKKLDSTTPLADPVRHEWISLQLLLGLLQGNDWVATWNAPLLRMNGDGGYFQHTHGFSKGLQTVESVLAYLVVTHHRLPRGQTAGHKRWSTPGDEEYIKSDAAHTNNPFADKPPELALKRIEKLFARVRSFELPNMTPSTLRAVATLSRMSLILADHHISSLDRTAATHQEHPTGAQLIYANTRRGLEGIRVKNQTLNWHLQSVGNEAGEMVQRMLNFKPAGLGDAALGEIRKTASNRFAWQNVCADALSAAQSSENMPTLVINIAGTGCGKTRMNVRAIVALRPPAQDGSQQPIRVASALNLRTLTLQTRDAYAEQLGLGKSELACILGSKISVRLHNVGKQVVLDDDENEPEDDFDFEGVALEVPHWLRGFLAEKPVLGPLIMSPVVVSTVDFLINAGEPHKQGNHGLAMLRAMHSDLILDEIDAYDPKAMVAVARLVTAYAMWGRNVVASSATLSAPVAKVLFDAFGLGVDMMNSIRGTTSAWRQAVIDDRTAPAIFACASSEEFIGGLNRHIFAMMAEMGTPKFRPAELEALDISGGTSTGADRFLSGVAAACAKMHARHAWVIVEPKSGFRGTISIGLVRVANIKTAIRTARYLADAERCVRVCCYHAQLGLLQRWNIEHTLDALLTRKGEQWKAKTVEHPAVADALEKAHAAGHYDVSFIVVATPVEEVGRDHDFDWAVIEPSSSQSIVQTAGRVNRHRLDVVALPNIAVLQYNFRTCTRGTGNPVFSRPGLESEDTMSYYGDHDLSRLVNWQAISECGQIDARLRYRDEVHPFAAADNASLVDAVRGHMERFTQSDKHHWILKDTYLKAPLRDNSASDHDEFYRDSNGTYFKRAPSGKAGGIEKFRPIKRTPDCITPRCTNDWLVMTLPAIVDLASRLNIRIEQATAVQVAAYGDKPSDFIHDESFGYTSSPAKY